MSNYIILLGLFLLIVGFSYIIVGLYAKKNPEKKEHVMKIYARLVLVFYFFFLFSLTFYINRDTVGFILNRNVLLTHLYEESNLVPFRTIKELFQTGNSRNFVIINLIGNIGALMPLGVLLPLVFPRARKMLFFTLMVTGIVLFIELVQFFFGVGRLDIDDLILNVFGAVMVFGIFTIVSRKHQNDVL